MTEPLPYDVLRPAELEINLSQAVDRRSAVSIEAGERIRRSHEVLVAEVERLRAILAGGSTDVPRPEIASIALDEADWEHVADWFGAKVESHGLPSGDYASRMFWPDGRQAFERDRLVIVSTDAELPPFPVVADVPTPTEPTCDHSWRFDGDDPYTICVRCGELRDALSGRVITPGVPTEGEGAER